MNQAPVVTVFSSEPLIYKGIAGTVTTVTTVTKQKPSPVEISGSDESFLLESGRSIEIEPTHRTTVDLIFNDQTTGAVRTIPAGTLCRRFASATAAKYAGIHLDYEGEWAANKNIERGYHLIWLEGALRGVHFSDIEPLEGTTND
jgi:hypothetical protein